LRFKRLVKRPISARIVPDRLLFPKDRIVSRFRDEIRIGYRYYKGLRGWPQEVSTLTRIEA
jgi:hypothetical protein